MNEVTSVSRFREYLRINTMQPNPDYKAAEVFLRRYSDELGLKYSNWVSLVDTLAKPEYFNFFVYLDPIFDSSIECVDGKPCVVMSWIGTKPELGSILLNSHIGKLVS